MRYVVIRDDDTNALTPARCLERLYRPFLDRGFPINLAVIPEVDLETRMADGSPEGYLFPHGKKTRGFAPIGSSPKLLEYLRDNAGFGAVQHGCHHDFHEFDRPDRAEVAKRLEHGRRTLMEAGLPRPRTFVAPYDKLSRASLLETSHRFEVISGGWYELGRLPCAWWPGYFARKWRAAPHWRVGTTLLLSHPGCLLSCHRRRATMMQAVIDHIENRRLAVIVTHWWEFFPNGQPDESLIGVLHELAGYLAGRPDVKVVSFDDVADKNVPWS